MVADALNPIWISARAIDSSTGGGKLPIVNAVYLLSLTLVSVLSVHGQLPQEIVPPSPPVLKADFDGDGVVNMFDLTMLEVALGTDDDRVDLNGDGTVSLLDLFIFAGQFNTQ